MVNIVNQTVYAFSKFNTSRIKVITSIEAEMMLVILVVKVKKIIFKIDMCVKIEAEGIHIKKRIFSNGKLYR
jgi:hypothetical protein